MAENGKAVQLVSILCSKLSLKLDDDYVRTGGPAHDPEFTCTVTLTGDCLPHAISASVVSGNRKTGKNKACLELLRDQTCLAALEQAGMLKEREIPLPQETVQHNNAKGKLLDVLKRARNCASKMPGFEPGMFEPVYEVESRGTHNVLVYYAKLKIKFPGDAGEDGDVVSHGVAKTKKSAEQQAAAEAMKHPAVAPFVEAFQLSKKSSARLTLASISSLAQQVGAYNPSQHAPAPVPHHQHFDIQPALIAPQQDMESHPPPDDNNDDEQLPTHLSPPHPHLHPHPHPQQHVSATGQQPQQPQQFQATAGTGVAVGAMATATSGVVMTPPEVPPRLMAQATAVAAAILKRPREQEINTQEANSAVMLPVTRIKTCPPEDM